MEASCARVRQLDLTVLPWYDESMKTAISIPDDLFESADSLAQKLGISRSQLYASAVAEYLAKHRGRNITRRLDKIYSTEASPLDASMAALQSHTLRHEEW